METFGSLKSVRQDYLLWENISHSAAACLNEEFIHKNRQETFLLP